MIKLSSIPISVLLPKKYNSYKEASDDILRFISAHGYCETCDWRISKSLTYSHIPLCGLWKLSDLFLNEPNTQTQTEQTIERLIYADKVTHFMESLYQVRPFFI